MKNGYELCPTCKKNEKQKRSKECVSCARDTETNESKRAQLEDRLFTEIQSYIKKHPAKPVLRPVAKKAPKATDHEMVLMLSDTHFPEVVEPEEALGLQYNADICLRRLEYLRDTTIRYKDLRASAYHVQKLTVPVIGDMLSGDIHEELEITNQFPTSEALVRLAHAITDMGRGLAGEFPAVELIFMPGNHPRLKRKPYFKNKWNNWDYVLGHFVAALSGGAFQVQVPKSLLYVQDVFSYKVGMMHGDGVKSASFAGIPWYGLKSRQDAIQSLLRHLDRPNIDYLLMGHYHRLLYWQGTDCDLIINGSVKGGDEFIIGSRHSSSDPVQGLLTLHPKHGLTDLSRINLSGVQ